MWITLITLVVVGLMGYISYTRVLNARVAYDRAASDLSLQMEKCRRAVPPLLDQLLPLMQPNDAPMIDLAAGYALRAQEAPPASVSGFVAELLLGAEVKRIFAAIDHYADLKKTPQLEHARLAYESAEGNMFSSQRTYNFAVQYLRNAVTVFPGNFFKKHAGNIFQIVQFDTEELKRLGAKDANKLVL